LLPEDDLNLATVLKSPLFGLSEDQLFTLCHERDGTVWRALERRAGDDPAFAAAHAEFAALLARADYVPPYELYAEILGARGGRRKLVARLGFEANDPIDEFLGQALAYERAHPPSLQGFLTWLTRGNLEVKRDLDQGERDEVRIMTVHGAKGLQAPIVFLPDTMNVPQDRARILWDGDDGPFLWAPRRDVEDATATRLREAVRARQEQERRRLLYVAMTRACDRLYICGWESKTAAPAACWHKLITAGLQDIAEPVHFDFTDEIGATDGWSGDGLRLEQRGPVRDKQEEKPSQRVPPLPRFANTAAPAEPRAARPLAPSRMDADAPAARSPVGDEGARARGRVIHTLLEHLPTLESERRGEAAARLIAKHAPNLTPDAAGAMARAICDLIAAPAFAPLFGENSLAEVPIVGRIGDAVIAGQVDRLVVTPDRVLIVDYKSGEPPKRNADTPRAYIRQLAAYRAVLASIYPGRPISCAILWTTTPALIEIAPADLDFLTP
jgi:ATP-dependent helicase/nuclease subunit A